MRHATSIAALVIAATAVGGTAFATPPARTKVLVTGLTNPICIASTGADAQHLYVCERTGRVKVVDKDTGAVVAPSMLNISAQVNLQADNGLLSMCFDPAHGTNGYFYIYYNTTGGMIVLERYHTTPGTHVVTPGSAHVVWRYQRPLGHNGGWIGFGPTNGLMYITSGDGDLGGTYDFANRAQTIDNMKMGKILRIDPSGDDFPGDADRNYAVPAGNPFVGVAGDDEIWAYGLRNPWRASFDRATGDLYFGDVGMEDREELNFEPAASSGGRNYGWPCTEGTFCTGSFFCVCNDVSLTPPLHEYDHSIGGSITGGYVYRGAAIPALQGLYFFNDFLRAKTWSLRSQAGGGFTEFTDRSAEFTPGGTTSPMAFVATQGEDAAGELYFANISAGAIYKLVPYPCFPEIDSHPQGQTVSAGSTITLRVMGVGGDPLTFEWKKGMNVVQDGGRISGATTSVLTITNAQAGDAGSYSVSLTSPCGSVSSNSASVSVFVCAGADFNQSGSVTVQDLFDFLAAWFARLPSADMNGSGTVTIQDLFDFLPPWFARCL